MDSVVTVVVHDGVGEHEHHISLELGCRPDRTALNVLLDLTEIHPPEREKSLISSHFKHSVKPHYQCLIDLKILIQKFDLANN